MFIPNNFTQVSTAPTSFSTRQVKPKSKNHKMLISIGFGLVPTVFLVLAHFGII